MRKLKRVLLSPAVTERTQGTGAGDILSAPLIIAYPFKRPTGPVIGAFLTGLREQVLIGSRAEDGRVIVPPEPLVDLDGGEPTPPTFRDYARAVWDLAENRPDLDPLSGAQGEGVGVDARRVHAHAGGHAAVLRYAAHEKAQAGLADQQRHAPQHQCGGSEDGQPVVGQHQVGQHLHPARQPARVLDTLSLIHISEPTRPY